MCCRVLTYIGIFFCHKKFIKVKGDVSEPNHLGCAKELTAPTDPRQGDARPLKVSTLQLKYGEQQENIDHCSQTPESNA